MENDWRGEHILRGAAPKPDDMMLMSNDYLALSGDPRIAEAQIQSMRENSGEVMMSAFFFSDDNPQWKLEEELARFINAETTIIVQSGYAANVGLIQSIAQEGTPVYLDQIAHRSLYEGIVSAQATPRFFRHNSPRHLEQQIDRYGSGVVVVDSVYSTNGSVCPLDELVPMAYEKGCVVVVDESHSFGTHGQRGEGLVDYLGLNHQVHFRTASLAKAFCGRAGVIACSEHHADYLRCEALPLIFSSALLPHEIAGLRETLRIIESENWRRVRLSRLGERLRTALRAEGYDLNDSESQIVSIEAGSEEAVLQLRKEFEQDGLFGAVFMYPATPKNRPLLRLSLHANLDDAAIDRVVDTCRRLVPRDDIAIRSLAKTRRNRRLAG